MDQSPFSLPLEESLYDSMDMIITFLPNILGALVLVTVGIILGRLVSSAIRRILEFANFNRLLDSWGITSLFQQLGIQKTGSDLFNTSRHIELPQPLPHPYTTHTTLHIHNCTTTKMPLFWPFPTQSSPTICNLHLAHT